MKSAIFCEPTENYQYHIMSLQEGKALYEVQRDGGPWALGNWEETKGSKGFMMELAGLQLEHDLMYSETNPLSLGHQ